MAFSALSSSYRIMHHRMMLPWLLAYNYAWRDWSCVVGSTPSFCTFSMNPSHTSMNVPHHALLCWE